MVIKIIVWIVVLVVAVSFLIKNYQKSETVSEKIVSLAIFFVGFAPIIIYYLDKYNVPTLLKWNENVNTQNWLSFISSYLSSIAGAVFSAAVLVIVTVKQMDRTLKENQARDKEERRINNMPLLVYEFSDYTFNGQHNIIYTKYQNCNDYRLNLIVENIGMNSIRKFIIEIDSPTMNSKQLIKSNKQSCIDKGKNKKYHFIFQLPEGMHKFKFKIYYQDLLFNWYSQTIEVLYEAKQHSFYSGVEYTVSDEKQLKRIPSNINNS